MSDRVVKQGLSNEYQTWDTPLSGAGAEFAPFFSLTSPAQAAPSGNFAPAEVSVMSQAQAKNEDWQVFAAPHEAADAGFSSIAGDGFGGTEAGTTSAPMMTPGHADGYDAGYEEGYEKGLALGQSEGEIKGQAAGQQQAQDLMQQRDLELQQALTTLAAVTNTLSDELLQPMQALALHMAKQLVRGELSISTQAIERLVRLNMEQLHQSQSSIQVHLNPAEFERLQAANNLPDQVTLLPNNEVDIGSVKVEQQGSWVEDLVQDRLAQLSQQALGFVDEAIVTPLEVMDLEPQPDQELHLESEPQIEPESQLEPEPESESQSEPEPGPGLSLESHSEEPAIDHQQEPVDE